MATPSQIGWIVVTTMLNRDDVLQVKGVRLIVLVDAAVLAASVCTLPHEVSGGGTNQDFWRISRAFACRIATRLPAVTYRSYSDRSDGVRSPSLHFRANSSTRACVLGSAFSFINSLAASTFRLRLTGSRRRSRRATDPLRLFMMFIIPAVKSRFRSLPVTPSDRANLLLIGAMGSDPSLPFRGQELLVHVRVAITCSL
jgi:hypothetical protein